VIFLDDYINPETDADIVNWTPVTDIVPRPGKEAAVLQALQGAHPHYAVYRKSEIPQELHYRDHYRISPIIGIADAGWSVTTRAYFATHPNTFQGGNHGYRPDHESMHGIFVAAGPALAQGMSTPALHAVDIYALMCHILGLQPADHDGLFERIAIVLRP
ncbi:MAG: alkaline phosphatase family protein, partial [Saprospiraceae bacterium]|nr:alkaline phosphatase family protein [Saprospiraceae bacterium]